MSGAESCAACRSLERLYQMMQAEIFATIEYPDAAIEPRHFSDIDSEAERRVAAGLRRPHAS